MRVEAGGGEGAGAQGARAEVGSQAVEVVAMVKVLLQ
jgi:hypothetical protein